MTRNATLALLIMLLVTIVARPEHWADKMLKDGTSHDFGVVPHGSELYHRFTVTNIFAVPMKITSVRWSSGCASAKASTEVIAPNKTGWIEVTMDASRFKGAKSITVFATIEDKEHSSDVEIKISATARGDLVLNPGSLNFGRVVTGESPIQTVDLEYAGEPNWKITNVVAKDAPVEATFKELYRKPKAVGYQISVKLKADTPPGAHRREIVLQTNDPDSPRVQLPVNADVQGLVTLANDRVSLGAIRVGKVGFKLIDVGGIGKKPFKVTDIDGLGDGIELDGTLPTEASTRQILTLKCKFEKEGEIKRKLAIKTNVQEECLVLMIEGEVIPEHGLSVKALEKYWIDLGSPADADAKQAVTALSKEREQSLRFLKEKLNAYHSPDAKEIQQLFKDLLDELPPECDRAYQELLEVGDVSDKALRKELQKAPSDILRGRLNTLLDQQELAVNVVPSGQRLQILRALAVLELIANDDAKSILQSLAKGNPKDPVVREAKAVLSRIGK